MIKTGVIGNKAAATPGRKTLKVGFIGLGQISNENVLGYLDSNDAEIIAVCSLDETEARRWLAKWNLPNVRWYGQHEQMLEQNEFDIVEILTPHYLHCEQAIKCAEAGVKGISLQKPMGINLGECRRIIETCERTGTKLKIYENFVFYPPYVKAKELIDQGLIGNLISIRIHTMSGLREGAPWPWCFSPNTWRTDLHKSGMGPLVGDDGFHKFSLARWLMGRDLEKVSAWIDRETPLDAPAFIRGKFKQKAGEPSKYVQLDFSFSPRLAIPCDFWLDEFVEIIGEKGVMWVNQCSAAGDREMFRGNEMSKSPIFPPIAVFRDGKVTPYLANLTLTERNWSTSFVASTKHFIVVMKEGGEPVYTGKDGMEIMRSTIAAYVSATLERDVYLEEITPETESNKSFRIETNFCNLAAFSSAS